MSKVGDTRVVEVGEGDFHVYILGRNDIWVPINVGGPGYLGSRKMESLNYQEQE